MDRANEMERTEPKMERAEQNGARDQIWSAPPELERAEKWSAPKNGARATHPTPAPC